MLVAGLLFTMVFGVLDLSLALNAKLVVSTAAREAARQAAIDGGGSEKAMERARVMLRLGKVDPEASDIRISPAQAKYGARIRVTIRYRHHFLFPGMRALAPRGLLLVGAVVTRSEREGALAPLPSGPSEGASGMALAENPGGISCAVGAG